MLPDGNGMQLFEDAKALQNTEVVLITGHASLETSIQALRLGAADYLVKPLNMKQLHGILSRVTKPSTLRAEADSLHSGLEQEGHFGLLWGKSGGMRRVYEQILRVAGTAVTVFVTGRKRQRQGGRRPHGARPVAPPRQAVPRGQLRRHLAAPDRVEIFGHEKGSFTGADRQHQGFFERASGGTLFLDEITEMPLDLQVKLLRVLETGTFMRVGSTQVLETDVRMIAATNRNPLEAVQAGKLREDLLYRLNVFPIHLPPCASATRTFPLIAEHFLDEISRREGQVKHFAPSALQRLLTYRWPGNVRELRNIVHRAYVMAPDSTDRRRMPAQRATRPLPVMTGAPVLQIRVGTPLAEIERQVTLATARVLRAPQGKTARHAGREPEDALQPSEGIPTVPERAASNGSGAGETDG
jgi:DNA-binding NtrC family response regulator